MDFGANKTPAKIIKEDPFGGTYLRDIYSSVNGKWYRKSWKEYDEPNNIDQRYYYANYYDISVNKQGVNCGASLIFEKIKAGLILQILMVSFSGISDIAQSKDI